MPGPAPSAAAVRHRIRAALATLAVVLGIPVAAAARAQEAPCPDGLPKVADLGLRRIEGNFSVWYTKSDDATPIVRRVFRFYEEPRIAEVDPAGPAAGKLREGDVLVAVENALITTREAGRKIGALSPGRTIQVTVRRDGEVQKVRIAPRFKCAEGELAERIRAGLLESAPIPMVAPTPPRTPRPPRPARPAVPARPVEPGTPAPAPMAVPGTELSRRLHTRGWFGLGLDCGECGWARAEDSSVVWRSNELPVIYQVDPGSPAAAAGLQRGDKLIQIDGASLLSEEGARKFGGVKPGQTVRWTFERDGETRTAKATALPRPGALGEYAVSLESLRGQLQQLERQGLDDDELRRRITELNEGLARVRPRAAGAPRLRWSGSVGDADVTVRGLANVQVTTDEKTGEIVITTSEATVRIKKSSDKK